MIALRAFSTLGLTLLLSACASDRISKVSGTLSSDIASFQGSLSSFQDDLKSEQDDEHTVITGTDARSDAATAAAREMQVEWTIASARTGNDIFSTLQTQGSAAVSTFLTAPKSATQTTTVSLPIDKLSAVAKSLDQLSKGQTTRADVEWLVNYGIQVNSQLQTIESKAKTQPKTPTAKPAAPIKPQ